MYSRYGKPLELPEHIIKTMPGDLFLDGELWFVYQKNFELTKLIILS